MGIDWLEGCLEWNFIVADYFIIEDNQASDWAAGWSSGNLFGKADGAAHRSDCWSGRPNDIMCQS